MSVKRSAHQSCVRRERYRFVSGGSVLTWERIIPGDSRVEQITASAEWFYGQMVHSGLKFRDAWGAAQ